MSISKGASLQHSDSTVSVEVVPDEEKVHLYRKILLAIGAAPLSIPISICNVYFNYFLLKIAGISPFYSLVILVLGRVSDAISDPMIGFLVNRTQSTGSTLRYWMLGSLPLICIAYFAIWVTLPVANLYKIIYYLVIYICVMIGFTIYSLPYSSLIIYQTKSVSERDSVTAFRMGSEVICASISIIAMSSATISTKKENIDANELDDVASRFLYTGLVVSFVVIITGLIAFFGTIERSDIHIQSKQPKLISALKMILSHRPYACLMLAYLSMYCAISSILSNFVFYFEYTLKHPNYYHYSFGSLTISAVCGIPFWRYSIRKIGKKRTVYCGSSVIVLCFLSLLFFPADMPVALLVIFSVFCGFCLGNAYLLPWTMLPDVVDDFTVLHGERMESIFYGFFVFFTKLAAGIAVGFSNLVLHFAGFDRNKMPPNIGVTIRFLVSVFPAICAAMFCFLCYLYPLSEVKVLKNAKILRERLKIPRNDVIDDHNTTQRTEYITQV